MGRADMSRPWWHFDRFDVVWCVVLLTVLYAVTGPPESALDWALVAPSLLLGKLIGHLFLGRK